MLYHFGMVCLVDPIGDVYACPFMIHPEFRASNVRQPGGFEQVWRNSRLFTELRQPTSGGACASCQFYGSCRGGCMAAKFFTGLPLDGPDPECTQGHGETALEAGGVLAVPRPTADHSRRTIRPGPVPVTIGPRPSYAAPAAPPTRACDANPLAGLDVRPSPKTSC
jgi:radical SAM protein with 4Fe4S-binding SPASM domain